MARSVKKINMNNLQFDWLKAGMVFGVVYF